MKKTKFYLFVCCTLLIIGCSKDPVGSDGTFKDSRDKHVYKYVKIGTQSWMAENLAYLPAVSPPTEGAITDPFYYVYNYLGNSINEAKTKGNYTSYGVLYNWAAAKTACPNGWHLPSDSEWTILRDFLGAIPGKKMKSISEWSNDRNGDNSSGFNAPPGGYRHAVFNYEFQGEFVSLGENADFWSTLESDESDAWEVGLNYYPYDEVATYQSRKSDGFSVRCLKNN